MLPWAGNHRPAPSCQHDKYQDEPYYQPTHQQCGAVDLNPHPTKVEHPLTYFAYPFHIGASLYL
jgi:hypothetical protein